MELKNTRSSCSRSAVDDTDNGIIDEGGIDDSWKELKYRYMNIDIDMSICDWRTYAYF